MSKILASALAISLALGGFAVDPAFSAPTGLSRPALAPAHPGVETVAHRVRRRRGRGGGDAAAAALFGAVIGGILANPCTFGNCGYDDGYDEGYYGGGGRYYGGGGRIHRGGFSPSGGGRPGGGFKPGGGGQRVVRHASGKRR